MHCDYCGIKYDIIGRIESFENDLQYIANKNNITSLLPKEKSKYHIHPSGGQQYSRPKSISRLDKNEKVIDYFSMLNANQLHGLHNMYKIDFELFGYSTHPYAKTIMAS